MPSYDLMIESPVSAAFIVTADSNESAESLIRESLAFDYAGEGDPTVLASRVSLISRTSGQAVLETVLSDLLS